MRANIFAVSADGDILGGVNTDFIGYEGALYPATCPIVMPITVSGDVARISVHLPDIDVAVTLPQGRDLPKSVKAGECLDITGEHGKLVTFTSERK